MSRRVAEHSQINFVVADCGVPIWDRGICEKHEALGRPVLLRVT